MILGELINALEEESSSRRVTYGFGAPSSWRGSYDELAFRPVIDTTVGDMLAHAESAIDSTYHGWKGGEYKMGLWTPCHINYPGDWHEDDALNFQMLNWMLDKQPDWTFLWTDRRG